MIGQKPQPHDQLDSAPRAAAATASWAAGRRAGATGRCGDGPPRPALRQRELPPSAEVTGSEPGAADSGEKADDDAGLLGAGSSLGRAAGTGWPRSPAEDSWLSPGVPGPVGFPGFSLPSFVCRA
eukprot:767712-Hanusia_phi.AAC.1